MSAQVPQAPESPHAGHRERLRRRFAASGLDGFAPHEVLELLLTYAIPRRDVNPVAHRLIAHFGSLHAVLQASPEDLRAVEGVGEQAAVLLSMMLPLLRAYRRSVGEQSGALATAEDVIAYCEALLMGERYEQLYVIGLDAARRVLSCTHVSQGDEGETAVYPRRILSALLRCGAASAVLAHNHPQGGAQPSQADRALTEAIARTLRDVGIRLADHVITGERDSFSFEQQGLLQGWR